MAVIGLYNNEIMKKLIFIGLFSIVALLYFNYIYGWLSFYKTTDTPKKYLSVEMPSRENYKHDNLVLVSLLKKKLINYEGFFNNRSYFDSTEIIIDTIIYNADFTKIAAIVVVKNPTYRQISPDLKHKYYYDATSYLGIRKNSVLELSWVGPVFTNSVSYQRASVDIRNACFRTFVTPNGLYKYNMNDKRFWNSSIWIEKFISKKEDM